MHNTVPSDWPVNLPILNSKGCSVQTVAQMWQFSIFKMAAVCHLGFIMCMFGPPAKSIGGIYHYAVCPIDEKNVPQKIKKRQKRDKNLKKIVNVE